MNVGLGEPWRVEMLGGLRVTRAGHTISRFRTQKTGALLAYLAFYADRTHSREILAELLWPDADPTSARHSLRLALSALRRLLESSTEASVIAPADLLLTDRFTVRLAPGGVTTDVEAFETALAAARQSTISPVERRRCLETAAGFYGGSFLAGLYEPWILPHQLHLEEAYEQTILELLGVLSAQGDREAALRWAHLATDRYPDGLEIQAALDELQHTTAHDRKTTEPSKTAPPTLSAPIRPPLVAGTITVLAVDTSTTHRPAEDLRHFWLQQGGQILREAPSGEYLVAFGRARDGLTAILANPFPRAVLHTGEVTPRKEGGNSPTPGERDPTRVALELLHTLPMPTDDATLVCTEATALLLQPGMPGSGVRLLPLGTYRIGAGPAVSTERIFAVLPLATEATLPALNAPRLEGARLPLVLTRFFGRTEELTQLETMLRGSARLITLTGPGGIGKSRLALEAVGRFTTMYTGGVVFVPLADINDPNAIPGMVRRAMELGLAPSGVSPLKQISDVINAASGDFLLILDNAEHLLGGILETFLLEFLALSPTLRLLVTSRCLLSLPGVIDLPLRPLPIPPILSEGEEATAAQQIAETESVALFADRARAVQPTFAVTPRNVRAVAELCRRLEGIPLALELAGARAGVLSPAQMLGQVASRLDLLTRRRTSNVADRHRSLRAALQWSYDLLTIPARNLFVELSVFRGGWILETAGAVLARTVGELLEPLEELRLHSLIYAEESAGMEGLRFRMLETLREFGLEHLEEAKRADLTRCHALFFGGMAQAMRLQNIDPSVTAQEHEHWLRRMESEHDNIHTALAWFQHHDRFGGLRFATRLGRFWYIRGYLEEGCRWLVALIDSDDALPPPDRGAARVMLGTLCRDRGDTEQAARWHGAALELLRPFPENPALLGAMINRGLCLVDLGRFTEAEVVYGDALTFCRERGEKRGEAVALHNLSLNLSQQSRYVEAISVCEQSLELFQTLTDRWWIATAQNTLGWALYPQGSYERSLTLFKESRARFLEMDSKRGAVLPLLGLAAVYGCLGEFVIAEVYATEAPTVFEEIGDRKGAARAFGILAWLRCFQEDFAGADLFYQQVLAARGNTPPGPRELFLLSILTLRRGDHDRALELLRRTGPYGCEWMEYAAEAIAGRNPAHAALWLGAAEAHREAQGRPRHPCEYPYQKALRTLLQTALGEQALAEALAKGRTLPWEQVTYQILQEN